MEKLLKVEEVCDLLQVSRSTVYEWTHTGFIPHYKFPKGIRFRLSEVENWVKRRRYKGREALSLELNT